MLRLLLMLVLWVALPMAHPLGNFSANHYAKFQVIGDGVVITYVIDLAEIPTFELLRQWGLDRNSPREALKRQSLAQSRLWMGNLALQIDDHRVTPLLRDVDVAIADGAGNLPIIRISAMMFVRGSGGRFRYEDRNYDGRAGWKEIVIAAGSGAHLESASQTNQDRSQALTAYPSDAMVAPPQDLRAAFVWAADTRTTTAAPATVSAGPSGTQDGAPPKPAIHPIPQPAPRPAPPASSITANNAPGGSVVRNDFLSRLLHREEIPLTMVLAALGVAFALGAAHALTPGHGKTIVAAYLVGSRGTLKHAALLGATVTFTHTISVFALGLATLFLYRSVVPENVAEFLGVVSGSSIVVIGGWMLWKRVRALPGRHAHPHTHDHAHGGEHQHPHEHHHEHRPTHDHSHAHDRGQHLHGGHDHGPGGHTHLPAGDFTWGSLVALGVSGGLVPCESALVLLLSAISLGRAGLGLLLLVAFSLGLAGVLMTIGVVVVYTKQALPERVSAGHSLWLRWASIASAAVVMLVGIVMTSVSLGWLSTRWLIG